ncbi:hypothetical protein GCM10009596_34050 [Arthrobacter rhombi]
MSVRAGMFGGAVPLPRKWDTLDRDAPCRCRKFLHKKQNHCQLVHVSSGLRLRRIPSARRFAHLMVLPVTGVDACSDVAVRGPSCGAGREARAALIHEPVNS